MHLHFVSSLWQIIGRRIKYAKKFLDLIGAFENLGYHDFIVGQGGEEPVESFGS